MDNMEISKVEKILKKIRETRKSHGLSHENMAIELDMSPSAYNKLEQNVTTLSLLRFLKIIEILKIPLTDAFDIKTGDILHQDLKDNSIGKVETLHQENKDVYEKLISAKDEQIDLLKSLIAKKA
ncbi:MAG: helix-turn-helix transcriptional regulator [Flavobacterium sp.]